MIVAAAIKHEGITFTGFRHAEIIHYLVKLGYSTPIPIHEQGFINHYGIFLHRDDARTDAKICKQIPKDFTRVLTSEDLW